MPCREAARRYHAGMSLRARFTKWLGALGAQRGDAAGTAAKRARWRRIANACGLTYQEGPHAGFFQGDRMVGERMGRNLEVAVEADYAIQKLVVEVSVTCQLGAEMEALSPRELVAWYESRQASHDLAPLPEDLASWVAGRRLGNGTRIRAARLQYLQLYEIADDTLEMLIATLPAWALQLELASQVDAAR